MRLFVLAIVAIAASLTGVCVHAMPVGTLPDAAATGIADARCSGKKDCQAKLVAAAHRRLARRACGKKIGAGLRTPC